MLAEVQYGGRVTDDFDKRLLNTFTNVWFNDQLLVTGFKFYDGYTLPDCKTVEEPLELCKRARGTASAPPGLLAPPVARGPL